MSKEVVVIYTETQQAVVEELGDDTLKFLQDKVGGYIDVVQGLIYGEQVDIWINDEGIIRNLDLNVPATVMAGQPLFGNAVLALSNEEGETVGLSDRIKEGVIKVFGPTGPIDTIDSPSI